MGTFISHTSGRNLAPTHTNQASLANAPLWPVMRTPQLKNASDSVRFSGAKLLADQMIRFDAAVTPESAVLLSKALVQLGQMKNEVGGSVKLMISNSPGGSVYHGYHIIDTMDNLEVPVDTIIMGGQTASMGALIFISGGEGRRFMSKNASLLVHRPSASGIGGTQNEISQTAHEIERMRHRIDHLISSRSNISVEEVAKMTDTNTIVYPLKALKLGFTDWVLVGEGNKALTKKSIAHLSDAELEKRDTAGNYKALKTFTFDPMLSNLSVRQTPKNSPQRPADLKVVPAVKTEQNPKAQETPIATALGLDIYPYPRSFSVYA